jgi:hypothetical protein
VASSVFINPAINANSASQFLGGDGTAGAPTFSFTSDPTNGMYLSAADTLGFSAGGTLRLSVSGTAVTSSVPILAPNGTAGAPGFAFSTEATTGWYLNGASWVSLALAGTRTAYFDSNGFHTVAANGAIVIGSAEDVSLSRGAANRLTLAVGDAFNLAPTAFASLPAGAEGNLACVTDSNTATWGATIAGGGANNVLAFHNGTNWTVFGA